MKNTHSVSLIILTKNAGDAFAALLNKVFKQKFSGEFEVLIIDSGSSDNTLTIAKNYPVRIYTIKPEEFQFSRTRNLGGNLAKNNILVYISQDAIPIDGQWLEKLVTPLKDSKIAAVYGRQTAHKNANLMEKFFYHFFYPKVPKTITSKSIEQNLEDFYVSNAFISNVNAAMKKSIWTKIKFDESIIFSLDKKWALDVLKAGYNILYMPDSCVYHSHNYSLISAFKRRFDDGAAMQLICKGDKGKYGPRTIIVYLINEFKYLVKSGHFMWIPYTLIYESFKLAGIIFGRNVDMLPYAVKIRLSENKKWWISVRNKTAR
ncbi:MAG: glycosyltransferase family 2 protein [Candidatus Freyarchaeum deiterrae]